MVVRRTCRNDNMVAGVLKYVAGGVAGVGALECDLKEDVEEVLLETDDMVVIGSVRDFFFNCRAPPRRGG